MIQWSYLTKYGVSNLKNRYHIITVIACCFLTATSVGICFNTSGVFFTPVAESLGVGRGTSAMQATLSGLVAGFISPVLVKMFEKWSARWLILGGVLITVLSTALMGFCTNIPQFYLLGIIRGASHSFYGAVPITIIINNWFEKMHGTITGVVFSFSGIAGVILNPLFSSLIESSGWQNTYFITAGIILAVSLPCALLIHYRPSEIGLLPYGRTAPDTRQRPAEAGAAPGKDAVGRKKLLFSSAFILVCTFGVFGVFTTGMGQFLPGYAQELGTSLSFGASMLSAAMAGNIGFKFIIGALCDRFKPIVASICMLFVGCIGLIIIFITGADSTPVLMFAAFLFGAVYSVGAVGVPLVTRYIFGTENYAYLYSYTTVIINIGATIPFALIGLTYDLFLTYKVALAGCIVLLLLAMILLQVIRIRRKTAAA